MIDFNITKESLVKNINIPDIYKPPSLIISGIPLPAQYFSWSFTPGITPYVWRFKVQKKQAEQIEKLSNPVSLSFKVYGEINKNKYNINLNLANLYLVYKEKINNNIYLYEVQDRRFLLRGKTVTLRLNKTLITNYTKQNQNIAEGTPAVLRQVLDRYAAYRYIDWSINGDKPWTAFEALQQAFEQLPIKPKPQNGIDNGVVVENLIFENEPVESVVPYLCSLARVGIGIDSTGELYYYDIDSLPTQNNFPNQWPVSAGVIYKEDKKRIRPKQVNIRFRKKQEIIIRREVLPTDLYFYQSDTRQPEQITVSTFLNDRSTQHPYITDNMIDKGRAVACFNVVKLPVDMKINGRWFQQNTWIPMRDYLSALSLSEDDVRQLWCGGSVLENFFCYKNPDNIGPNGELDPIVLAQINAVRHHYRQTYMIDPYWIQRWESWDVRRVAVIDPTTRYSALSPVWVDTCIVPKIRPQYYMRKEIQRLTAKGAFNWEIDKDDVYRENPSSSVYLSILSKELGVFRLNLPRLATTVLQQLIISCLDKLPTLDPTTGIALWKACPLKEDFTMEAIISATLSGKINYVGNFEANTSDQFYNITIKSTTPAYGPEIDRICNLEPARYGVGQGLSTKVYVKNQESILQAINDDKPINGGYLEELARIEGTRILRSYTDRWAGRGVFPGVDLSKLRLFGQCKAITIEFSESYGLRSIYDCSAPPTVKSEIAMMSDSLRRLVYAQIDPKNL